MNGPPTLWQYCLFTQRYHGNKIFHSFYEGFLVKQFRSLWRDESRWIRNNKSISRRVFCANFLLSNTHSVMLSCVVFIRLNILMKLNFEMISNIKSQLCLFTNLNLCVFVFLQTSRKMDHKPTFNICTFCIP